VGVAVVGRQVRFELGKDEGVLEGLLLESCLRVLLLVDQIKSERGVVCRTQEPTVLRFELGVEPIKVLDLDHVRGTRLSGPKNVSRVFQDMGGAAQVALIQQRAFLLAGVCELVRLLLQLSYFVQI
jgi:hypothetical protein